MAESSTISVKLPYYLTGHTALIIPEPRGRHNPLWFSSAKPLTDNWLIGGATFSSTRQVLGDDHLWEGSSAIAQYEVPVEGDIWIATYERAVFDLLYHYCEIKRRPLPNVQVSDIDDVVDIDQVTGWVVEFESPFISKGRSFMTAWLTGARK